MVAYAITDSLTLNSKIVKADMILYRDKSTLNYTSNAKLFLEEAKQYDFQKVLLHRDYRLAYRLGVDGIHLTSTQFSDIVKAKALGLFVIMSTHTIEEALKAETLGVDMVTFSPIFATPNKGKPKGIELLKRFVEQLSTPVIALGGIVTKEQIDLCAKSGVEGFASIRCFL